MRSLRELHEPMFRQYSAHPFSEQLARISEVLDACPAILEQVLKDLAKGKGTCGAKGMSAETVLRAALLKQAQDLTYDELSFQLADSQAARAFARLQDGETYSTSALQANISAISTATWQSFQLETVRFAQETKFECGRTVRMDATVAETNIAYPSDSSMLVDALRVVSRHVHWLTELGIELSMPFSHKAGRKLMLKILNARNDQEREDLYRPLIVGAGDVWRWLPEVITAMEALGEDVSTRARRLRELQHVHTYLEPILAQTIARVIDKEPVAAGEKIISLFEPHSDVIIKGSREIEFGRKVFFTTGRSNIVTDVFVAEGNLPDAEVFITLVERHKAIFGKVPRQTTCDGGFASQENVHEAHDMGVKDVCFTKKVNMEPEEMCSSRSVFKKLAKLRAGIESNISALKRAFGLSRVSWKGEDGFMKCVWSAVVAYNLFTLTR